LFGKQIEWLYVSERKLQEGEFEGRYRQFVLEGENLLAVRNRLGGGHGRDHILRMIAGALNKDGGLVVGINAGAAILSPELTALKEASAAAGMPSEFTPADNRRCLGLTKHQIVPLVGRLAQVTSLGGRERCIFLDSMAALELDSSGNDIVCRFGNPRTIRREPGSILHICRESALAV
jgi:hypothetical protein